MVYFIAITVFVIVGSAAGSWWWVTTRLSVTEGAAVYDIEEAADFAASRLPDEVNARLDREQLMYLLGLHLSFFRRAGMATYGGVDDVAMAAANTGETVVAHEDEAVDFVLRQLVEIDDPALSVDVVVVLELSNQYLASIGALGPSIPLAEDGGA
ncbi:MAG: hypothetical protein ACI88C_000185 [Acidimicrobiales bacterium]